MKKYYYWFMLVCMAALVSCSSSSSRLDQYHAEKHQQDSVALVEQQRTLVYYQGQLDSLVQVADSLLPLFQYEKNEKYEDAGYYVVESRSGLRVKVRDDGHRPVLVYREGKRLEGDPESMGLNENERTMVERGEHLAIVISDMRQFEQLIQQTNGKINMYRLRLERQDNAQQ